MNVYMIRNKETGKYYAPNYSGKDQFTHKYTAKSAMTYKKENREIINEYEIVTFKLIEISKEDF